MSVTNSGWPKALLRAFGALEARTTVARRPLPIVTRCSDASLPQPLISTSKFSGEKYDVPWAPGATAKPPLEVLKMIMERPKAPTADQVARDLPPADVDLEGIRSQTSEDPMRVTWVGHATLLVQMNGLTILTDPMFSRRCSASQWVGPERYAPPALSIAELPPVDVVLVSHSHYDHLDELSVLELGNDPLWVVPLGLGKWFQTRRIDNVVELGWWDHVKVRGDHVKVVSLPAQHWSARTPFDRNRTLWCGWAVLSDGGGAGAAGERFCFAGDTAYHPGVFDVIGSRLGPFDFAAIPIGAYEPRWFMKSQHCDPEEAVLIHKELRSRRSCAVHWGTFPLASDDHLQAPRELAAARKAHGVAEEAFEVLRHGESVVRGRPRSHDCLFAPGGALAA